MPAIVTSINRTDFTSVKTAIHRKLIQKLNLDKLTEAHREDVRREVSQILEAIVHGESTPMNLQERERLVQELLDEVFGLGPLEPLLADPTVSDILVNTYKRVYVERKGLLEKTSIQFRDDTHLMGIIDRIVSAIGRRIDESSPMVDARLADGSRVNAIIPPLSLDGPCLSHSAVWCSAPHCRGSPKQYNVDSADARTPARLRQGKAERSHLWRYGRRQNHFLECTFRLHLGQGTDRHH